MTKITLDRLNAEEIQDLATEECNTVKGGWIAVAAFVVNTGLKLKQYQDGQAAIGQQAAYQGFFEPDPIAGNVL